MCRGLRSSPSRLTDAETGSLSEADEAQTVLRCGHWRRGNPLSFMRCQQMNHAAESKIQSLTVSHYSHDLQSAITPRETRRCASKGRKKGTPLASNQEKLFGNLCFAVVLR